MNTSKANTELKNIPGVNVTSCIVPCTELDNYPTHDSQYGIGGWREVDTIEERDAIPTERRRVGMAVRVNKLNKTFILRYAKNNYCWYEENSTDVSDIINDAIARGEINIDLTTSVTFDKLDEALVPYIKTSVCESNIKQMGKEIKEWVNEQNFLTEHQSLADYATKEEVNTAKVDLENSIQTVQGKVTEVETNLNNLKDTHNNYVTSNDAEIVKIKSDIDTINEALGGGEEQSFATKDELKEVADKEAHDYGILMENVQTIAENYLQTTEAAKLYATKDNLNDTASSLRVLLSGCVQAANLPSILDASGYVTRSSIRGYATEFYVRDYVATAMAGKVKLGDPIKDCSQEVEDLKAQVQELTRRVDALTNQGN